ncbi:MAG: NADH-quinone oxidoreductase subunit J [Aliifodinibius sp.]|nr:cation:proton antiporter subunit C [candidate division Zixibacteria bacterium]NIV11329.1 NADH-quinone oxidoreductase subunit J [Fodinibius sp.]
MADGVLEVLVSRINYWVYIALMMIGLYGIIIKNNIMKKIIGLSILQTAVILFFVSIGAKRDATIPIIDHTNASIHTEISATHFINPLPHVLMLTAIVVAVATLGVALSMIIKIYREYNTLEEDEILPQLREEK